MAPAAQMLLRRFSAGSTNLEQSPGFGSAGSVRNLCPGKSLRKMLAAQRHVALVAADLDLRSLAFGGAIGLDTHGHDGLPPAVADGLDLHEVVRPCEQLRAAGKQLAAE